MFKKRKTNRALRSNYSWPCWWQSGLSGSWIRAASDVLCLAVISYKVTVSCSVSPQKPHKDKRAELKLQPPWGTLPPQWKPLRTWVFSTSKENSQPPPIIRLLLGPADFQPLENKNAGVIIQAFRSLVNTVSAVTLKLRQQPWASTGLDIKHQHSQALWYI